MGEQVPFLCEPYRVVLAPFYRAFVSPFTAVLVYFQQSFVRKTASTAHFVVGAAATLQFAYLPHFSEIRFLHVLLDFESSFLGGISSEFCMLNRNWISTSLLSNLFNLYIFGFRNVNN